MFEFDPFWEYYPGENLAAKCTRFCRKMISIDPSAHRTRENFKSSTAIKAETLRHLLFYPNTIHCFSRFRYFWEILMLITYGLAFLFIPIHVAFIFGEDRLNVTKIPALVSIINTIYLINIPISFISSYQDPQSKKIVLERSKIASNYIRNYFWIDVLSSLPDQMIIEWFYSGIELGGNDIDQCTNSTLPPLQAESECLWDIIIMLTSLKLLHMPLFFKYLVNHLDERKRSLYSIKIIKNVLSLIFFYNFFLCFRFLIMRVFTTKQFSDFVNRESSDGSEFWIDTTIVEKYIICFFYVTSTLTLFAGLIEEKSQVDMTFAIIYSLIGAVVNYLIVSQAYIYLTTANGPSMRFQEIRSELMEYVAFKRIPKSIQLRILTYYDYIFKSKFYRRGEINALYMGELRHLITNETCQQRLAQNYLFKMLPDNVLHSIASCMAETIYLRNDVICHNDRHRGQKLFLIVYGTVAVYTEDGMEVAHLHDGSMFGENEFIQYRDSHSYMNYVAVEECKILVLHRNDFMRIMAENVELINQMRRLLRMQQEERVEVQNFAQPQYFDDNKCVNIGDEDKSEAKV